MPKLGRSRTTRNKVNKGKGKYTFTLKNIDLEKLDHHYGILSGGDCDPSSTTKVDELLECEMVPVKSPATISFLDESKHLRKCTVSFIDYQRGVPLDNRSYHCCWDHHPIPNNVQPIGCPIRYISDSVVKSYQSEISNDFYTIRENITRDKAERIKETCLDDTRLSLIPGVKYISDKVFCSFNCVKAFINSEDNRKKSIYRDSEVLLYKLYGQIYGEEIDEIVEASDISILYAYGGTKSIESYRNNFNRVQNVDHGTTVNRFPEQISVARLLEEKIKLVSSAY